jgi:transposase
MDRSSIVRAANDGGNWRQLAEQLGVNHKTAYTWIREGRDEAKQKGGRRGKCTNEQIDVLVVMIESDPTLTLRQLPDRTLLEFGVHVRPSTIHNYLQGKLIALKKAHAIPPTMNTDANKELRKQYVQRVSQYMRDGKTIIWMVRQTLTCFAVGVKGEHVLVSEQLWRSRHQRD